MSVVSPLLALVGRPNVGKSTLFNRLTKSRNALVANSKNTTRDRQYGHGYLDSYHYRVIDMAGLDQEKSVLDQQVHYQIHISLEQADYLLLTVDGRAGIMSGDYEIAAQLRKYDKPIILVVNKTEGIDPNVINGEFYGLNLGRPHLVSAEHGRGISGLIEHVFELYNSTPKLVSLWAGKLKQNDNIEDAKKSEKRVKRIAVVGKPNVGKSTLINHLLGEERLVSSEIAGTTRDSISVPFSFAENDYLLIDTAGVRRRNKVDNPVEKFSILKTLKSIELAQVVVLVLSAKEGCSDQDIYLLNYILTAGKGIIVAFNKWDKVEPKERKAFLIAFKEALKFGSFVPQHFMSALNGKGIQALFPLIEKVYQSWITTISTPILTRLLGKAVAAFPPMLSKGRQIKLRFAHSGGHSPPTIIIHGKQTDVLPLSYQRYLENFFRRELQLIGTPIRIKYIQSANPYVD